MAPTQATVGKEQRVALVPKYHRKMLLVPFPGTHPTLSGIL